MANCKTGMYKDNVGWKKAACLSLRYWRAIMRKTQSSLSLLFVSL